MKRICMAAVIIICMFMPLSVWLVVESNPLEYFTSSVPPGQLQYVLSKLVGLYANFLLWLHVVWVLLRNARLAAVLPYWRQNYHRIMGIAITLVITLHVGLFVTAVSLRKGVFAYELLLPNFSDYYHSVLALGVLSLYCLPVIIYAGLKLQRDSSKIWLHRFSLVLYLLVFFHGIGVGSETKSGILFWTYLLMGISVLMLLLMRIINSFRKTSDESLDAA